jgi:hypothetical protein
MFSVFHHIPYVWTIRVYVCECIQNRPTDRPVCRKVLVYFLENEFMKKIGFGSPFSSSIQYVRMPPQIFHSHYTFLSFNSYTFSLHHSCPPSSASHHLIYSNSNERKAFSQTYSSLSPWPHLILLQKTHTLSTQRSYCSTTSTFFREGKK